jgi:hypothetical protein
MKQIHQYYYCWKLVGLEGAGDSTRIVNHVFVCHPVQSIECLFIHKPAYGSDMCIRR